MTVPNPTPIFRIVHVDCVRTLLQRGGLHAANHTPNDSLPYRPIHNVDIQSQRHIRDIPCGPRGTLHDYVPFYFGYLSPMLLQLKTGRVTGYNEGQEPLVYLKSTVQAVVDSSLPFVFSNGHGIAAYTGWFDDVNDMDRQRRKQGEFLIYQACPWTLIQEIGVLNAPAKTRVEQILNAFDATLRTVVNVRAGWYY